MSKNFESVPQKLMVEIIRRRQVPQVINWSCSHNFFAITSAKTINEYDLFSWFFRRALIFQETISVGRRIQVRENKSLFKLKEPCRPFYSSFLCLLNFVEKTLQQDMLDFLQGAPGQDFHDITLMVDGEPIGAHKVRCRC